MASFYLRSLSLVSALSLFVWYCTRTSMNPSVSQDYVSTYSASYDLHLPESVADATPAENVLPKLIPYHQDLLARWTNIGSSLSIILPVQSNTIQAMTSTLLYLLQEPFQTSEVILMAPSDTHGIIRNVIRNLLTNTDSRVDFDISIQPWSPSYAGEALAILEIMTQVTSDRVLILDVQGLVHLHPQVVRTILDPPLIDLPIGPRAYNLDGDDFICFSSPVDQLPGFLVPPVVIPSNLLIDLDISQEEASYGTWASISENLASFRPDNVGGVVINLVSAGSSFCSSEHDHSPSNSTLPFLGSDSASYALASNTESEPLQVGTFAFVFPLYEELTYLLPVICRIRKQGHHVHALISDSTRDKITALPCDMDFAFVSESTSLDEMGTSVAEWILTLPSLPDIIITPDEDHGILIALDFVMRRYSSLAITRIQIPLADLPFCDWMGSLSLEEWRNWHRPQLDITVITNDRPESLKRLLKSLSNARFFGDKSDMRINLEQTADKETLHMAADFRWHHGLVSVHRRVIHGGLLPAVVESWYPRSNHSYGLILEDDVELSPLFYAWVKMALLRYRYGDAKYHSRQMFGISLYQQKNLELRPEGRHRFSPRLTFAASSLPQVNTPYLSQIPCSWGAVYFPEHWQQFHEYLSLRLSDSLPTLPINTIVTPAVRSNKWTRSWKKYFIEMAYLRGYVMLYPNYHDYLSLSTNHLEVGSHVKDMPQEVYHQKQKLFLLPLLQLPEAGEVGVETGLLDLPDERMPAWNDLPTLDLLGLLADEETLKARGMLRANGLFHCDDVHSGTDPVYVPRWLCL
ncbi:hypothetical protein QCA50_010461 [Cerrena zonata]|uniref:Uncharacterized protein n=1 Tax=Cerrena zonata TaxID=2478898 RepID=A0AAW0FZ27_9APHY